LKGRQPLHLLDTAGRGQDVGRLLSWAEHDRAERPVVGLALGNPGLEASDRRRDLDARYEELAVGQ